MGLTNHETIFNDGELDIFANDYSREYKANPQQEMETSPVGDIFLAFPKVCGEFSVDFGNVSEFTYAFGEYILAFY